MNLSNTVQENNKKNIVINRSHWPDGQVWRETRLVDNIKHGYQKIYWQHSGKIGLAKFFIEGICEGEEIQIE